MLALGRFCHNLWQNWRGGIQTVEILTIPDVPWRETCVIREFRSHVKTDILKKTRTVSGFFCELLRYVLTEIPVEFDQHRIDGNRRIDLRYAVPALEVGNPRRVGLRLFATQRMVMKNRQVGISFVSTTTSLYTRRSKPAALPFESLLTNMYTGSMVAVHTPGCSSRTLISMCP